jgi:hypothetical protein
MGICYTNSKSKRYLCWLRRRLPQRMYNTPRRLLLAALIIIFDLEMVLAWHCGHFSLL